MLTYAYQQSEFTFNKRMCSLPIREKKKKKEEASSKLQCLESDKVGQPRHFPTPSNLIASRLAEKNLVHRRARMSPDD